MHAFPSLAASREPNTMRRSLDLVSPDQDSMKSAEEWLKAWTDVPCRLNPLELMCTCKGFRHHCICSHVLAVSHLLKGIDLKKELQELSKRREAHRPRAAPGRSSPTTAWVGELRARQASRTARWTECARKHMQCA